MLVLLASACSTNAQIDLGEEDSLSQVLSEANSHNLIFFEQAVREEDRRPIIAAAQIMSDFLVRYAVKFEDFAVLLVYRSETPVLEPYVLNRGSLRIETNSPHWERQSQLSKVQAVAHEIVHLLQLQGALALDRIAGTPRWLIEGTAEYIAYRALSDRMELDWNDIRACFHGPAQSEEGKRHANLELVPVNQRDLVVYGIAALAVEALAEEHGIEALLLYFRRLGSGAHHEDAFRSAFHQRTADFESNFSHKRLTSDAGVGACPL